MQINPVAVYGILDTLQIPPGKYLLQSAAGSAFGRMLISLAKVTSPAMGQSQMHAVSRRATAQPHSARVLCGRSGPVNLCHQPAAAACAYDRVMMTASFPRQVRGVKTINVVRRSEQVAELLALG
jgi:hypothetical protein